MEGSGKRHAGIVTLTTDFGLQDAYVGAMKGVMLQITPFVEMVDISHLIAPQDVMEGAFVLKEAYAYFPSGTVHLVVVDPGVGTARRPLALQAGGYLFVGPDNGLFPLLLGEEHIEKVVVLDNPAYWRTPEPSSTFHGRDIFAPVAAHLAGGVPLEEVGTPVDVESLQRLRWIEPSVQEGSIQGWVVHIDRFGNCITNIPAELLRVASPDNVRVYVGDAIIQRLHRTYGEVERGEPLALIGSSGMLEIAVNAGNAAELFHIRKGAPVNVILEGT